MDRYLSDLKEQFLNTDGVKGNPLIYSFNNTVPRDNDQELLYGETVLYPGTINGEYFMTKGHTHQVPCAEVYYGLEGEAIVLCEFGGKWYERKLTPGVVVYCEPGYAHRVINKSDKKCRFLCVCRADAGHDYDVKFSKRYFQDNAC